MSLVLGVDPGLSGAYAILDADGSVLALDDLPVIRDGGSPGWTPLRCCRVYFR
jgi:hypothetical protein